MPSSSLIIRDYDGFLDKHMLARPERGRCLLGTMPSITFLKNVLLERLVPGSTM